MKKVKPWLFLLPMLLFAVTFVYGPFLKTTVSAFCTVNLRGEITGFAGLDNFRYLFSRREFSLALRNTLVLTAVNVPVTVAVTVGLAALCNRKRRFSAVYEVLFMLPMAIAMSSAALIFRVMLNPTVGSFNRLLGLDCRWYEGRDTAMAGILMLTVWMGIGFNFLLFLAAFRAVPDQLTEAALMDGAGALQRFVHVQLPLITPTLLYVVCTNTVLALMTSGPVLIIIRDSLKRYTATLIYLMYSAGYQSSDYTTAACISLISFGMTMGLTLLAFLFERKKVTDP